ncbi:MAG: AGE family epimerase/isomerase [Christensenellaceae bacterium]|jgi:mannobiose 2-epimerase|nr:AGE family epimerase/isomerase [Christensenellaceae bacterium]
MNPKFEKLYQLAYKDLTENLLPWWEKYDVDEEFGGFYGEVGLDNKPIEKANKFITLNARLIWTFASAYRVLGDERWKKLADRAYNYFIEHFYDRKNGGFYTTVDYKGDVVDDHKFIYGNAFALYGLSEYARATGSEEALKYAYEQMQNLDKHVYDPQYKGYYEAATADWRVNPWIHGVNRVPSDVKTMNTHLHMIEAYTCHLRVNKAPYVQNKVREHLYVMLNKIVNNETHHYHYFQARDWTPTSTGITYGHDIEGSWLMLETAEVLGEPEAHRKTRDVCVNIARACYEEAFDPRGGLRTEYDPATGEKSERFGWWEQNEAVVGFLNAWEETRDEKFLDASLKTLEFTLEHFVDHERGGWYTGTDLEGNPNRERGLKVAGPICPYHNGRMSMEIIERYHKHKGE